MNGPPATDDGSIGAALRTALEHRHAGRLEAAVDVLRRALHVHPSAAILRHQLGAALEARGEIVAAIGEYRRAVQLQPDFAEAYASLGNALAAQGHREQAIASYRRAVAARPDYAEAHHNLAALLESQERFDEALAGYCIASQIEERPAYCAAFARCLTRASRATVDAGLRRCVARAIAGGWARPSDLARPAIGILLGDPRLRAPLEAVFRAWPARPAPEALLGEDTVATLADDALFLALLENAQVCDPLLERFLTCLRHALLEHVSNAELGAEALVVACAIARQCFLNDYVFALTAEEKARATVLKDALIEALRCGAAITPGRVAVVACYFSLAALADASALLAGPWPPPVRALLGQQVEEPATERALAAAMPSLTAVNDRISRSVQRQYEESPYPRWVRTPVEEPVSLDAHLRRLMPPDALPAPGTIADRDLLVAGCGTGQEAVALARMFATSRLLAIDLSVASLAYASRKTRELGIANVEYAQADILELAAFGREFDMISSVGVLHHMADPLQGWRNLAALLRPGGFMQVGLYSEAGRRDLAAARRLVAERGFTPDPEGIRRCREEILDSGRFPRLARLRDLYGMNECRDLLFHVEEHRFTLPQVRAMIEALALEFIGLAVEPAVARLFAQQLPGAALDDLDAWDAFEARFPDTFAGMYLFWVRKPAGA